MGKYLGVPSIQSRVSRKTYGDVLERVQQKQRGWKANCLSLEARVTLIKAIKSAIPSYVMQTSTIPKGICDQIDKHQRQFL